MAILPRSVTDYPQVYDNGPSVQVFLEDHGYVLLQRGKVRDTYYNSEKPDQLLVVASDRISIFDFVLNALIPYKGEVLTALSHFWMTFILKEIPNHLISSEIIPRYNGAYDIYRAIDSADAAFLMKRALLVEKLQMGSHEMIFRQHLGGSVWNSYQKTGTAGGHRLPPGLRKWSLLPRPLFTPSTKADMGHDINITASDYFAAQGAKGKRAATKLAAMYRLVYSFAAQRGIYILDSKFEVQEDPFILGDEVFTPDSSRFTPAEDFYLAMSEERDPIFMDKEPVRVWGRSVETPFGVTGINNLDPENPEHTAFVHNLVVPADVISETSSRYREIFVDLTGESLPWYQNLALGDGE